MANSSQFSGIKSWWIEFSHFVVFSPTYFLKPLRPGTAYLQASACRQEKWTNSNKYKLESIEIAFSYIHHSGLDRESSRCAGWSYFCWRAALGSNDGIELSDIVLRSIKNTVPSRFSGVGSTAPHGHRGPLRFCLLHSPVIPNAHKRCAFHEMDAVATGLHSSVCNVLSSLSTNATSLFMEPEKQKRFPKVWLGLKRQAHKCSSRKKGASNYTRWDKDFLVTYRHFGGRAQLWTRCQNQAPFGILAMFLPSCEMWANHWTTQSLSFSEC